MFLLSQLHSLLPGSRLAEKDLVCQGATDDSRKVRPGMLFCAYRGELQDGHSFIPQALQKGASAILAEDAEKIPPGIPALIVPGVFHKLGIIAETAADAPARSLKVIGITGTNGKTTTAWLLRDILRAAGISCGLIGTVEYDLGAGKILPGDRTTPLPFPLQALFTRMKANGVTHAVMEVSSHALEQNRMGTLQCAGAVFTNFTEDHLDYHHTMEEYFAAKQLLFTRHLPPDGFAVLHRKDEWGRRMERLLPAASRILPFSEGNGFQLLSADAGGCRFRLTFQGEWQEYTSPLCGRFNAENCACAALAALSLGIAPQIIRQVLAEDTGAPGRLQRIPLPCAQFHVLVDYAHTDDALRNVLATLKALHPHRLLVLFGCGGDRDRSKRPLMGKAAAEYADMIFLTSDNPRTESPEAILAEILPGLPGNTPHCVEPDRRQAIAAALAFAEPDDILLVAGKGHEDYQEIRHVKYPFSDAEVLQSCWKELHDRKN